MENSEKRIPERSNKHRQILNGALAAFARKGFYNTRISEIAAEAGVADGTIYLYFKNKDDLLISLFEDRMAWVTKELTEALDLVPKTFCEQFKELVNFHAKLAIRERDLCEFLTVELRQSAKFVRDYENLAFIRYMDIIHELVVLGQEEGAVRKDVDVCIAARLLFGSLDDVILYLAVSHATPQEAELHIQQTCQIFLQGLLVSNKDEN